MEKVQEASRGELEAQATSFNSVEAFESPEILNGPNW